MHNCHQHPRAMHAGGGSPAQTPRDMPRVPASRAQGGTGRGEIGMSSGVRPFVEGGCVVVACRLVPHCTRSFRLKIH